MDVFSLDGGDVSAVARHNSVLGFEGVLGGARGTLLWKCA